MKFCLVEFFNFFICFKRICDWLLNHFYVTSLKSLTDIPNVIHLIVIESWLSFLLQVVIFLILGTSDLLLYPRQFSIVLEESVSCLMTLFGFSMLKDFYSELWFGDRLMFRALQGYDHQFSLSKIINLPTCLWCCHLILWASENLLLEEGSQLWACGHKEAPLGKNL